MSDDPFYQPPPGTSRRRAVLDWNSGTYKPLDEIEGEQPYYTYQGIGNITGVPIVHVCNLTFKDIQVTFNGEDTTFKCD